MTPGRLQQGKGVDQVKPDQWGPLVSDWGWLVPLTSGPVNGHVSAVKTDAWGHCNYIKPNLF